MLAPSRVTGVSLSKEEKLSLKVTWNASQSDEGVTDYQVQYRMLGGMSWGSQATVPHSQTSTTLTGLNAGTAYDVRVRARSGNVSGQWSEVETEKTYGREF